MKAQMVKNAVIVPVGAKGGFVVKRAAAGRPRPGAGRGHRVYSTLIRGMLDITDNIVGGGRRAAAACVRLDGDDPYLVVAADKGTADASPISANGVSRRVRLLAWRRLRLGRLHGYDHKKMGITARGAWESVKRHFRELGRDTQTRPVHAAASATCRATSSATACCCRARPPAGRGLRPPPHLRRSRPGPAAASPSAGDCSNCAALVVGRLRPSQLSAGGGVWPSAPSRRCRSAGGPCGARRRGPAGRAQRPDAGDFKAPVDLLFFGGIGNYVKASTETHAEAGEKANDTLRIDGHESVPASSAKGPTSDSRNAAASRRRRPASGSTATRWIIPPASTVRPRGQHQDRAGRCGAARCPRQ